jgi:hypothetical protein
MVDRFQNGETDVLICTFGVGSTGRYCVQHIVHYCITRIITQFHALSNKKNCN